MLKCQKQLMKAFPLKHETSLLPMPYGAGQVNVSPCYSLQLPDNGWAVGRPHQADFPCLAPSSGCLTCHLLL